ncbi:MAG TPA: hypothetical protein VHB99_14790, partial [Pirellulales bacterium]|nr:hypothetical protein [Pirellulales bacterium]
MRTAGSGASMAHLEWSFDEVEASVVADKLATYGFSLPFKVEGVLSLHVDIGVPWRSPLTSEEYDLKGDLKAARLVVAGVELRNVRGQWEYAQGLLTLEHLKLELPAPSKPNGVFVGAAEMKLSPPGDATARFSFAQLEISALSKLAPEWAGIASGQASGRAEARAPVARLEDPATWRARANAEFEELKGLGLPAARLSAEFQLTAGVVHASKVKVETDHTHMAGDGQFGLSAPYAYSASLRLSAGKLSHLNGLHPEIKLPLEISGRVGASAKLNGSLEPREFSLVGGVNARDLRVAGLKLDEMKFTFDVTHDRLHVHPLSASLYGGSADLSLAMAMTPDGEIKSGLRWRKVRIDQLAADSGNAAESLRGAAAGGALQLRAPAARYSDPSAWHAHGTVDLEHPLPGAQNIVKTAAKIHLAGGVLRIDDFDVSLGANRLAGSLELKLGEPFAYRFALMQTHLDLGVVEKLLPSTLVGAARPLAGELTMAADLHGTLNPLAIQGRGELAAR